MKAHAFRTVEDWKNALSRLPDSSYFELARSVLGDIKTPFNKQRLTDSLEAFFLKNENRQVLAAYIDGTDHKVIAAVALLGEPTAAELEGFFADEFSPFDMHGILINLEERFILYRFPDEGQSRLALNPLLEPVLAPFIADSGVLFESEPLAAPPQEQGALSGLCLGGLISFILDRPEYCAGRHRKKFALDAERLFPGHKVLLDAFRSLGLLREKEDDAIYIDEKALEDFASLGAGERQLYIAAAILVDREKVSPFFDRREVQTLASLASSFIGALTAGRVYPEGSLRRILYLAEKALYANPLAAGSQPVSANPAAITRFFSALETTSLLLPVEGGGRTLNRSIFHDDEDVKESAPVLTFDGAFSLVAYPGISFDDVLRLARFASIRETGTVYRFEVTRESAVRGFDQGLTGADMLAFLERLSGGEAEQHFRFSIDDWERRYREVSLYSGTVLTLAEERRFLAESGPIAALVMETLAPGVYLLESDADDAAQALSRAGVDIVAKPAARAAPAKSGASGLAFSAGRRRYFPYIFTPKILPERAAEPVQYGTDAGEKQQKTFQAALERLKFPKEAREELQARIRRRLILSDSQLEGASIRYEKTEASGLDYTGKQSIARQAAIQGALVEASWQENGESRRAYGAAAAVEKSGSDLILAIRTGPAQQIRIPIAKISYLRKIKSSIFGE